MAEKCELSPDMTILDACCGSGRSAIFLAKQYGCRIVRVDIEPNPLLKAQAEAISKGVSDLVAFRVADATDLPFQDQTFDGAIFQAALIFTNKAKALHTVNQKRALKGMAADVVKLKTAKTVQGQEVKVDASKWHLHKSIKINDANIVKADVVADNGVIHVIDTVILPK